MIAAVRAPNFTRLGHVEEVVAAVKAGSRSEGRFICEKPLARNLPEARRGWYASSKKPACGTS